MASGPQSLPGLEEEARAAIRRAGSVQELVEVRARYLGRKGSVSALLRGIGKLEPEARGRFGEAVNRAKQAIEACVRERRRELEGERHEQELREHHLDVTLPGAAPLLGHLHPMTVVERDMYRFFTGLGFSIEEGPEVETDYHNFGALNFPDDHPARDVHDTFFVEGGHLLRTHTSPVQIRAMSGRTPPFRFIAPGRVYRHESSSSVNSPVFHQIEGFIVDEKVTFGDLKGVLYAFARHLMGPDVRLRFRASFFPFTEPSAELDFGWGDGWLEWGGCGMIHPQVLSNVRIDPARYQGFAFGMGVDRTAMRRFGLPSINLLFDPDVRVLEQL